VSDPRSCSTTHSLTTEHTAYLCDRSEASAIPTLLIAASGVTDNETDRSMYSNGRGDHRAVYRDGLWVGVDPDAARQSEDSWFEEPVDLDPREQSYKSILRRYERLRATLANADPKELTALRKANPTRYKILPLPVKRQAWLSTLDREFPTPARLAQIDEWNVFCALQYCAESLGRDKVISKEKSCWIWSLLALAGEKGTLDYYRAGRIRDLGHKAGQLSVLLRNGARPGPPGDNEHEDVEEWHADSEVTEGEDEAQDDDDDAPPPAKAIGAQVDGTEEKDADSDNSADMSMSEDEGEIRDDDAAESEDKTSGLQEARARLLAQLGDRLVQPSIPPSKAAGYRKDESNRNNFRTEHKEENADAKLTQPPTKTYASRAEAEWQRQKMREEALAKAKPTQDLAQTDAAVTAVTLADSTTSSAKDPEATSRGQATPGQENIFKHGQEESHQVGRIDLNTRVTIDMILTVVAECYGQRDLLRYRKEW
jgi:hypothetical protein